MALSSVAAVVVVFVVVFLANQERRVNSDEVQAFKARIGFSRAADLQGVDGVRANWDDLARALSPEVKGKSLNLAAAIPLEPGVAKKKLIWTKGDDFVAIWVFVSGIGFGPARERLVALASETMRTDIPFQPGPSALGDLSTRHVEPPSDTIIWAYRNVCVYVRVLGGEDAEPIARAVQRFMHKHLVARVAAYLPRVDHVDVSAQQIHVGEEWRVSVGLAKGTPESSVLAEIHQVGDSRLEALDVRPLIATFRGREAGPARVEIHVVDRKTLLSPPLAATVDVLPAR